jgi:hypothetical protein
VLGLLPADVLKDSQAPMADAASLLWAGSGIAIAVVAAVSHRRLVAALIPRSCWRRARRAVPDLFAKVGTRPVVGVLVGGAGERAVLSTTALAGRCSFDLLSTAARAAVRGQQRLVVARHWREPADCGGRAGLQRVRARGDRRRVAGLGSGAGGGGLAALFLAENPASNALGVWPNTLVLPGLKAARMR